MSSLLRTCEMDSHGLKHFNDPSYTGTQIMYDPVVFTDKVNEAVRSGSSELKEGYAPFCKHIFVPNFVPNVKCGYAEITPENESKLKVAYEARNSNELPVLVSFFNSTELEAPMATWLDVILYSKEQITEEYKAMGETPPEMNAPWGIISIKAQMVDHELPMQPITMMRNALGKHEGGSGVPLVKELYIQSVDFWKNHASLK